MPNYTDAHIDRALTQISVGYFQKAENFIADQVFPQIPVKRQSDLYYEYNRGDFMRDEARERAAFSESAGGDFGVEAKDPYYCRKYAFHKDIAPEERLNYDEPLDVDTDSTEFLTQKMLINREMNWASTFFGTGIWDNELTGEDGASSDEKSFMKWDQDGSDPIKDITKASVEMASKTAYRPNTLVLSPRVFYALKNHYDILDRIKYTQKGIVTTDLLATLFEVDKVLVPWAVVNSAEKGADEANDFIYGANALLCYSNPSAGLRQPSAGYIFAWNGLDGSGEYGNRMVRLPMDHLGLGTERLECEMSYDIKMICNDLGTFFSGCVDNPNEKN